MNAMLELRQRLDAEIERARAVNGQAEAEDRDLNEGERAEYDGAMSRVDELNKRMARLEMLSRFAGETQAPAVLRLERGDNEERAFAHYLRTGDASGITHRAYNNTDMNIGTPADGGYAVPTGLYNQIIARRDEALLAPKLGVRNIGGKGLTVRVPIDNEADVLFLVESEAATIDQDAPALYYKDLTLAKYAKYITPSWELLRDEDANLMGFIMDWVARGVAATHNSALITEALANGTAGLTVDSASTIGAAEIPELVGKLAPEYQEGAQWILAPTTVALLQGLSGNAFYFAPMSAGYAGRPTLWGFPVNQSSYASAIAASAKSLVFGNFNYMAKREVQSLFMLRDPYTVATSGQIRFHFWFDMVYGVLQAEAIQYATHPAS
jgi:HK97 family phage major capsid protein